MSDIKQQIASLNTVEIPCPLCIIEDRYGGAYSGASFLAFNKEPYNVWNLPVDAGDTDCEKFWANEDTDYPLDEMMIGKGNTPQEALANLIELMSEQ